MPESVSLSRESSPANARCRLGLVLSGGGSRAVAQIGVIRALLEEGIVPSCVVGVSGGALVGALYAAGYSPIGMLEFFKTTDPFRIAHVSFGKPGLLDPIKLVPLFQRYFPVDSFAALRTPLKVVATDLQRGTSRVFDSGPLLLPVLASSSFPMVFSPVEIEGRWYGDGGIIDNFPVRLLQGMCDVTLGVHASPLREWTKEDLGSSLAVLQRSLEVGMFSKSRESFEHCHVVIQPEGVSEFGMFTTGHFTEIEACGYKAARKRIAEIKQLVAV
ncbi:MAG: patatin-like phospholipase family protein [Candidatus Didemnitutus sp.]|nr:patatin-like phospholipase family protein [Candidatus Didemnitutus sp.]